MTIEWAKELNTGIDVIDSQHKRILDYINMLEHAIKQHDHLEVGKVLDELVDYTMSHFAFEESLQLEAGYKLAKPHKAIHDVFAQRVATYQQRHRTGENVAEQLYSMLATWLLHHIKREDMAYVSSVSANIAKMDKGKKGENWMSRSIGMFFK